MWERDSPAVLNSNLRMTEYNLVSIWTNATVNEYALIPSSEDEHDSIIAIEHIHYYGKFGKITEKNKYIFKIYKYNK